ncbi:MAG: hypothetical protein FWB90_04630 [Fibromonadales bacterium]|nr:hypothetical protein [Fibromonadales bacterium]
MKGEDKGFEVCGEMVQTTANQYIFTDAGQDFRLLLNCLYAYEKHGILPFAGGFLEQSAMFGEAVEAWGMAPSVFMGQKRKMQELLKGLGAFGGKRR